MRRTLFYLSVALAAFGIGSLVVFNFFWKTHNSSPNVETTDVFNVEFTNSLLANKTKQATFIKIDLKNLSCEDETLQIFWNRLKDQTVSINTDYAEKIKDCSDVIGFDDPADLNNDGRNEIFIRSVLLSPLRCGNNCKSFWVFQKIKGKGYRKLFEAEGNLPEIENKKTNGYKDIKFSVYAKYVEVGYILYKFNGTEYVPKNCWTESKLYKDKDSGDLVEGKKWKTHYLDCKESGWLEKARNLE